MNELENIGEKESTLDLHTDRLNLNDEGTVNEINDKIKNKSVKKLILSGELNEVGLRNLFSSIIPKAKSLKVIDLSALDQSKHDEGVISLKSILVLQAYLDKPIEIKYPTLGKVEKVIHFLFFAPIMGTLTRGLMQLYIIIRERVSELTSEEIDLTKVKPECGVLNTQTVPEGEGESNLLKNTMKNTEENVSTTEEGIPYDTTSEDADTTQEGMTHDTTSGSSLGKTN